MKKILILLIMLMISSIAFAGNYNPETQEITTNLQKGWNLIPVNIIHADIGYAVDTCPLKYSYVYDPVSKSYWSEEYSNGVEHMNSYSYNLVSRSSIDLTYSTNPLFGVAWVYSETTCELNTLFGRSYESAPNPWTNELKSNLEDKLRLVSGWNFITINPFMIGLNTKDIFQNCSVEKAATRSEERRVGKEGRSRGSPYH